MKTKPLTQLRKKLHAHLQTINRHIQAFKAGFDHDHPHPVQFESLENRHLLSAVSFDEALHGDLSANASNNPILTLDLGQNTISGSISHLNDPQDQFTINLLDGQSITSVTLQTTSTSSPFGTADITITSNELLKHLFATSGTQIITDTGFSISNPNLPIDGNWSDTINVLANFAFPGAEYELTITVEETPIINTPPDANHDTVTMEENTSIDIAVLMNDTDDDDNPLTSSLLTDPSHGTATLNSDGTINYTPNANFVGTDTFTYMIDDGFGGTDSALVEITVNPAPEPPAGMNDQVTVNEDDGPLTIDVLINDDNLDNPTIEILDDASANANFTLNDDGTITFNTNGDFDSLSQDESTTREITYRVTNQDGLSDTATLTVNILGQNDPPVLVAQPDDISIKQGDASSPIDLSTIFTDSDTNDTLTYLISTEDPDLVSTQVVNGQLIITSSSELTGTATLKISAIDSKGATMTTSMKITVQTQTQTLNDQLMSLKDKLSDMNENGTLTNKHFKQLNKTIDRAMKIFDRGNFWGGISQLFVFKLKVHTLECRGKISHDDAKDLSKSARKSINTAFKQALENQKHRCWHRFR